MTREEYSEDLHATDAIGPLALAVAFGPETALEEVGIYIFESITGVPVFNDPSDFIKAGSKKVGKEVAENSTKLVSKAEKNPYIKKSVSELKKSKNSFEKLIKEHKQKLKDYMENPDKFDNKDILKKASPENRKKIIKGRVKSIEKQIKKQEGELKKVNDAINKNG